MLSITATDLPRFMACNGSRLMEGFTSSIAADDTVRNEGNAAHWLVEQVHSGRMELENASGVKAPNGVFITDEIIEHVTPYIVSILALGVVEYRTSFQGYNWEVRSRADHVNQWQGVLNISDFKYGWGIVEAENNWTLIAHAIGWVLANPDHVPHTIRFTIFQPRPFHRDGPIRTWEISYKQLLDLYTQLNAALSSPTDILNTSAHCYKCPKFVNCPAARKAMLNGVDVSERAFDESMDNVALSLQLDVVKRALDHLTQTHKAYSELAHHRIRSGANIANYSLENDFTNRVWKEFVTHEITDILTGQDLTKKQLITPTQAEKLGVVKDVMDSFSERRNKGAKLVRIDDNKKAESLFKQSKGKK